MMLPLFFSINVIKINLVNHWPWVIKIDVRLSWLMQKDKHTRTHKEREIERERERERERRGQNI